MKRVVENRRAMLARGEGQDIDDCLSAMLAESMNDTEMLDHLTTLLSAGHDTTAYFSAYMCFLLASHQEIQSRLRAELVSVLGPRYGPDCDLTGDEVGELKCMQKVMQETLRLYSIIPCVSRLATYDVHIKEAGVTIPQGSNLLIPMFLINRDPELWENPSDFNPERFEGKGNEFTSAKNGFFPFGYGSRTCIGNTLAQYESAVFMAQILMRFRIEPDPGFKPAIFAGISLTTSNGINVKLIPI
jgi:cytochrome P450